VLSVVSWGARSVGESADGAGGPATSVEGGRRASWRKMAVYPIEVQGTSNS
jgi:hypothetical protein